MRIAMCAIALFCVVWAGGVDPAATDPRLQPINEREVVSAIRRTPIRVQDHERLIYRAVMSGQIDKAYEEYTALWKRRQKDPVLLLLRGEAALGSVEQEVVTGRQASPSAAPPDWSRLPIAISCLAEAAKLAPTSAPALREYGYVLWRYGTIGRGFNTSAANAEKRRGAALIAKAESLDPLDPVTQKMLGSIELNLTPGNPAYDRAEAERHLRKAIELDPQYAAAHCGLSFVYNDYHDRRPADVEREKRAFHALIPKGVEYRRTWIISH